MRFWKGIEKEGIYKGRSTLFVESNELDYYSCSKILEKLHIADVENVYFGAGRVDLISVDEHFLFFVYRLLEEGYGITLEYSATNKQAFNVARKFDVRVNVVATVDVPGIIELSSIKIDTGKELYISDIESGIYTEDADVDDGLYPDDVLL